MVLAGRSCLGSGPCLLAGDAAVGGPFVGNLRAGAYYQGVPHIDPWRHKSSRSSRTSIVQSETLKGGSDVSSASVAKGKGSFAD